MGDDQSDPPADDESDPEEGESGWGGVGEFLAGFQSEQVPSLLAARELEPAYPLLHALTRGRLKDFLVRVAALEALVEDGRSAFSPWDVVEMLYWLKDPGRDHVMRTLRESGWLTFESPTGYRITEGGQFVAMVLSFLRARVREQSLLPTVEGVDYMLRVGVDPLRQVLLLRTRLESLRLEMEEARSSHSEVLLNRAADRLQRALALSERIRSVLGRVPTELADARRVAQEIHDLLSRLHGVGSDLHAAITEVGRQYVRLMSGMTAGDIVATLMQLPVDELAAVARDALRPVVVPPPLVIPEALAAQAEAYLSLAREPPPVVSWTDPPAAEESAEEAAPPEEALRLLDELDRLAQSGRRESLAAFLPRGTPAESFLRATLLPLLGQRLGGEGVAARIAALPLRVTVERDDLVPATPPLTAVSDGHIGPSDREDSHG